MGKMKVGSTGSPKVAVVPPVQSQSVQPQIEQVVERIVEIPKPVTKDVIVEISKPVYNIVEVEQVVQKPKIKVEEVQQTVIKPVFTIKQETIILDQMQKKLEESVAIAINKLNALNACIVQKNAETQELQGELKRVKTELVVLKVCAISSVVAGIVAAFASVMG